MRLKHSKTPNGSHAEVLFFYFLKYLRTILLSSSFNLFICCNEKQTFFLNHAIARKIAFWPRKMQISPPQETMNLTNLNTFK